MLSENSKQIREDAKMRNRISRTTQVVMVLACCVALVPIATAQQGRVAGTKSGFVTTADGVKIHYLEAKTRLAIIEDVDKPRGSYSRKIWEGPARPAILFVPGWTMPAEIWEKQIAHLAKTHWVVAMDPRSQGLSSQTTEGHYPAARARDIKAVVDQLKLAPVVLVGWSMGVAELAAYVDQFGTDTLAGLVLVDGIAGGEADPALTKGMFGWAANFQHDRRKATDAFVRSMYKKPQSEAYYQRVIRASLRTPTNSAMALFLGAFSTDNRPALAKINKPTLIVVAAGGPWMAAYEDLHKRIAGSRMEIFENVGHALFVDEPERFNALLDEFLRTLE